MKPSYNKLVSEFLKKRAQVPRGVAFQFSSVGISETDYQTKIDFLCKHKVYFTTFPKSVDVLEIKPLFEWVNRQLAEADLSADADYSKIFKTLSNLETLLLVIREERLWLLFDQHKRLLEILWNITDFDIIQLVLKIALMMFRTKLKVMQLVIQNLTEEDLGRFFLMVHVWMNGVNLLNKTPVPFVEKFSGEQTECYRKVALNAAEVETQPLNFGELENMFRPQKLMKNGSIEFDLEICRELTIDEIADKIHQECGLTITKNSLEYLFLKVRLGICQQVLWRQSGWSQVDQNSRQKLITLTLWATTLRNAAAKNPELNKAQRKMTLLFEEHLEQFNTAVPLELLESFAYVSYLDPKVFANFLNAILNYYNSSEISNDQVQKTKRFSQSVLERLHESTYCRNASTGGVSFAPGPASLSFPVNAETIIEILKMVNLVYLGDSRSQLNNPQFDVSHVLELLHNLQSYFIEQLLQNTALDEQNLEILVEIKRTFLQEINRDRESVMFELFADNLRSYLKIFYSNKEAFPVVPGTYSTISILVFETIEALESYFIDQSQMSANFKIARMARSLLESKFWEDAELVELVINYPSFSPIFNELIVLFHDLLNNIPEVTVQGYVTKFSENGFLPLIIGRIGTQTVANEYDSLGFLFNLLSKVILHNKDLIDDAQMENIIKSCFQQIFVREAVINNFKRFNGGDSNTALKNFADEVVGFCNVHSRFAPIVSRQLIEQIREVKQINRELAYFVVDAQSAQQFMEKVASAPLILKNYGWFTNFTEKPLTETEAADDFNYWQKTGNNYLKFLMRFFDNLNTNLYNNINTDYEQDFGGKPIIRFLIQSFSNCCLYYNLAKKKKIIMQIVKLLLTSHNQTFLQIFAKYFTTEVTFMCSKLLAALKACQPAELQEAAALLLPREEKAIALSDFEFSAISVSTKRFLRRYSAVACLVEAIKVLACSNKRIVTGKIVVDYFLELQSTLSTVLLELTKQNEKILRKLLIEELQNHIFELYIKETKEIDSYNGNYTSTFLLLDAIQMPDLSVVNETISKTLMSSVRFEFSQKHVQILYLGRFVHQLEQLSSVPAVNFHTINIANFCIGGLKNHFMLAFHIQSSVEKQNFLNQGLFMLSKVKFFSVILPAFIKLLFNFIAKLKKQFKRIHLTKAEKNNIFLNSAYYIFWIETKICAIFIDIQFLIEKIMKFKPLQIEFWNNCKKIIDLGVKRTVEFERLRMISALILVCKSIPADMFECFYLQDKPIDYFDSALARLKSKETKAPKQNVVIQSEAEHLNFVPNFEAEDRVVEAAMSANFSENIPWKINKNEIFSTFTLHFANFLEKLTSTMHHKFPVEDESNLPKNYGFYKEIFFSSDKSSDAEILTAELMLFREKTNEVSKTKLGLSSEVNRLIESADMESGEKLFFTQNPLNWSSYKEDIEKLNTEIETNFDSMVIYFFNNWLHFCKGRNHLKKVWAAYAFYKRDKNNIPIKTTFEKLLSESQEALKLCIEGKTSKSKSKTEFRMVIREKESFLNLILLQLDLYSLIKDNNLDLISPETILAYNEDINAIAAEEAPKTETKEDPLATPMGNREVQNKDSSALVQVPAREHKNDSFVNYALNLIQKCLNSKYKKDKIQKLIIAVFSLFEKLKMTLDEKLGIVEIVNSMFTFYSFRLNPKDKEKSTVIHEQLLLSIMTILCVIFNNDEQFLERFATVQKYDLIRQLLKVRVDKQQNELLKTEIHRHFNMLVESVLRQPHVFKLLVEAEIKNFLYAQPNNEAPLDKLKATFEKPFAGNEAVFAQVLVGICEQESGPEGKLKLIRLEKNQDYSVKPSEIKSYVTEFVSILINDVHHKIQKPTHTIEQRYAFDHLVVCETLFFQILPRYPIFYSLFMSKHKSLFLVHFVERFLDIHPGYYQFVTPVFLESPYLVKDSDGNFISVTKSIRAELITRLTQSLQKKIEDLEKTLALLANPDTSRTDHQTFASQVSENISGIDAIFVFFLRAMQSENFNREIEQRNVFPSIIKNLERVFQESAANSAIDFRHFLSPLILPEALRRRQVIKCMNPDDFSQEVKKENLLVQLHVPTTFRLQPQNWVGMKNKAPVKSFTLDYIKDFSYDALFPATPGKKMSSMNDFHLRMGRRGGQFFQNSLEDELGMQRGILGNRLLLDNQLIIEEEIEEEEGMEEDDQQSEVDDEDDSEESSLQRQFASSEPVIQLSVRRNEIDGRRRVIDSMNNRLEGIGRTPLDLPQHDFRSSNQQNRLLSNPIYDSAVRSLLGADESANPASREPALPLPRGITINPQAVAPIETTSSRNESERDPFFGLSLPDEQGVIFPSGGSESRSNDQNENLTEGMEIEDEDDEDDEEDEGDEDDIDDDNEIEEIDEIDDEEDNDDDMDSDDESDNTDEERLSNDQQENQSMDENDAIVEFEAEFGVEGEEEEDDNGSHSEDSEEDQIEFIEDNDFVQIEDNMEFQSQQDFPNFYNDPPRNNERDSQLAKISISKLFTSYPFMMPLNLAGHVYCVYNDPILDMYRGLLEETSLPFAKPGNHAYYKKLQKEFEEFKITFSRKQEKSKFGPRGGLLNNNLDGRRIPLLMREEGVVGGRADEQPRRIFIPDQALPERSDFELHTLSNILPNRGSGIRSPPLGRDRVPQIILQPRQLESQTSPFLNEIANAFNPRPAQRNPTEARPQLAAGSQQDQLSNSVRESLLRTPEEGQGSPGPQSFPAFGNANQRADPTIQSMSTIRPAMQSVGSDIRNLNDNLGCILSRIRNYTQSDDRSHFINNILMPLREELRRNSNHGEPGLLQNPSFASGFREDQNESLNPPQGNRLGSDRLDALLGELARENSDRRAFFRRLSPETVNVSNAPPSVHSQTGPENPPETNSQESLINIDNLARVNSQGPCLVENRSPQRAEPQVILDQQAPDFFIRQGQESRQTADNIWFANANLSAQTGPVAENERRGGEPEQRQIAPVQAEPAGPPEPAEPAEPVLFNFGLYGLPDNFLEIAAIDPTFFYALTLEFQIDTVITVATDIGLLTPGQARPAYRPINQRPPAPLPRGSLRHSSDENPVASQNQNSDPSGDAISVSHAEMRLEQENNLLFIESLSPEVRIEVLTYCPQEFLLTLPEHIQTEAQQLREQGMMDEMEVMVEQNNNANQFAHTNKIQQSIKKNRQRDLIKKNFGNRATAAVLYPSDDKFLDVIIHIIDDKIFKLQTLPISHISAILLNPDKQTYFYQQLLERIENSCQTTQLRALSVLEVLSYSNFLFFHEKFNLDRIMRCLDLCKSDDQLLNKLTRILNHIVKTTLVQTETGESCDIMITQENLDNLTCILYSKNQSLFEALTVILFMLSFNFKNLELIINSLQENIARLAFPLNMTFEEMLKIDRSQVASPTYFSYLASKINEKSSMQNGILKIFKLLEQLFKKSFSANFTDEKLNDEELSGEQNEKARDKRDTEKSNRFNEIKSKVLGSFANYFKQTSIKLLFLNMFRLLNIYEQNLDATVESRRFAKPVFTKLMPLIESFFIIYKLLCDEEVLKSIKVNLQLKEIVSDDVQIAGFNELDDEDDAKSNVSQSPLRTHAAPAETREELLETKQFESQTKSRNRSSELLDKLTIETMFYKGVRSNRNLFNYLLGQIPRINNSALSVLIRHTPRLVNFDIKRRYFQQAVQSLRANSQLRLVINRDRIFYDSYAQLSKKTGSQLRGRLTIKFNGEEGVDAGGVQREWYNELSKEIFNPNYALFIPAANGYAYQPSPFSTVNTEHLSYFKFIGKMFGRALLDGNLMDAHFTRSFYKHMTGTPLNYTDLEDYDPDYFKNIKWILENDVTGLELDFTYEREIFGTKQLINLKPEGAKILVTNENKSEYVRLICEQKLTEEIRPQIKSFLEGLNSVIPAHLIKMFDPKELELMFSGMPEIDLQDLKDNTDYNGYHPSSPVIKFFWEVMHEFDESMKAGFLQFVTGTSKVPVEGFGHLRGMGGIHKFNIHKAFDTAKLPTSHTCMNQLDLPNYETKVEMKEKLTKAILYGKEGFGFA